MEMERYKIVFYDTEKFEVCSKIVEVESYRKAREVATQMLYRTPGFWGFTVFFE